MGGGIPRRERGAQRVGGIPLDFVIASLFYWADGEEELRLFVVCWMVVWEARSLAAVNVPVNRLNHLL